MKNYTLIGVKRIVEINELGNGETIQQIDINHVSLEELLIVFKPHDVNDPLLYDPYEINKEQLQSLVNSNLIPPVEYDGDKYQYLLACFGKYIQNETGELLE